MGRCVGGWSSCQGRRERGEGKGIPHQAGKVERIAHSGCSSARGRQSSSSRGAPRAASCADFAVGQKVSPGEREAPFPRGRGERARSQVPYSPNPVLQPPWPTAHIRVSLLRPCRCWRNPCSLLFSPFRDTPIFHWKNNSLGELWAPAGRLTWFCKSLYHSPGASISLGWSP